MTKDARTWPLSTGSTNMPTTKVHLDILMFFFSDILPLVDHHDPPPTRLAGDSPHSKATVITGCTVAAHRKANTTQNTHVPSPYAFCLGSYEHDERLQPLFVHLSSTLQ